MKKAISLILAVAMCLLMCVQAFAIENIPPFFLFVHIIQNHLKCTNLYLLTCSLTTI